MKNKSSPSIILKVFLFMFLLIGYKDNFVVNAAWNNNAYDYVQANGEKLIYKDNAFWFAQYGVAGNTSGTRYTIIGFTVKTTFNGNTYSFKSKVGGSFKEIDERTVSGKVYTMWKIDYNTVIARLKQAYPSVDFSPLSSSTVSSKFVFDAITTLKYPGYTTAAGSIDDYGNVLTTPVYTDVSGITNAAPWDSVTKSDIAKLFGVAVDVAATAKPTPIYPTLTHFRVEGHDYKDPNSETYWVKPTTNVSFVTESGIPKSNGIYPDSLYVRAYRDNLSSGKYLAAYKLRSNGYFGTFSEGSYGNVTATSSGTTMNQYVGNTYNHIAARFYFKFGDHGSTYALSYASLLNGQYSGYKGVSQIIKVDGSAPSASLSPNSSGWTKNNVGVWVAPSDSGSGVARWQYRLSSDSGNSWGAWSSDQPIGGTTINLTTQGKWQIEVWVKDKVGYETYLKSGIYHIDKTAPSGSFSPNSSDWTKNNVGVWVSPSDSGGSGVARWQYRLSSDGGSSWGSWSANQSASGATINLTSQGNWKIQAWFIDNAGNEKTITSGNYYIDKTVPNGSFNVNSSGWTNNNIGVLVSPSDSGGSGIARWQYRLSSDSGNSWGAWSSDQPVGGTTINLTSQGNWKIQAWFKDNAGNETYVYSGIYYIDKSLPNGAFSPNSSGWTNSNISIKFNTSDTGGSAVSRWQYRLSSNSGSTWGAWSANQPASGGTINLTSEGKWQIEAWVVDTAGNEKYIKSGIYHIDKTLPSGITFTPNSKDWTNQNIVVNWAGSDAFSGVNSYSFRIVTNKNGAITSTAWSSYNSTTSATITAEGVNHIEVSVKDNAGNIKTFTSGLYHLDKSLPSLSISTVKGSWRNAPISVSMSASDVISSISRIEYKLSGATSKGWTTYSSSFNVSNSGKTLVTARSIDLAGNVSGEVSAEVWVDMVNPTANFTTKYDVVNRNITINASNIVDIHSGVNQVKISNFADFSSPTTYNISGKSSTSLNFTLDKKSTIAENYSERTVYIRLYDNVNNYSDYQIKVYLNPAKPGAPKIKSPSDNNPLFLRKSAVNLVWEHQNGENDFMLPQTKATINVYNEDTDETTVYIIEGDTSEFTLYGLTDGQYVVTITTNNFGPHTSDVSTIRFRYNKFSDSGLVRSIVINPGSKFKFISVDTLAEIPAGCSVEGKIYYEQKENGNLDYTKFINFDISANNKNKIITLTKHTSKVQVDLILKGCGDKFISPTLDDIKVYAK